MDLALAAALPVFFAAGLAGALAAGGLAMAEAHSRPRLGAEQVHHHIAGVHQHPIALLLALAAHRHAQAFQLDDQMLGHGRHLPRRGARDHDHAVGDGGFAGQIELDDVAALVVVEGGENGPNLELEVVVLEVVGGR
jgi:hypothetical protein